MLKLSLVLVVLFAIAVFKTGLIQIKSIKIDIQC